MLKNFLISNVYPFLYVAAVLAAFSSGVYYHSLKVAKQERDALIVSQKATYEELKRINQVVDTVRSETKEADKIVDNLKEQLRKAHEKNPNKRGCIADADSMRILQDAIRSDRSR